MIRSNQLKTRDSCMKRRKHAGIPILRAALPIAADRNAVGRSALMLALLSRAIRKSLTEAEAQGLWESNVLTGFDSDPGSEDAVWMLTLVQRSLKTLLGTNDPEWEDVWESIKNGDDHRTYRDMIRSACENIKFPSKRTAELAANRMIRYIDRYLDWEKRVPQFPKPKVLDLWGTEVQCAPDVVFDDGMGILEVVRFFFRKPDVTVKGNKRDFSAKNSLELYALWRYGETLVQPGQTKCVSAQFLYMRRDDEKGAYMFPEFAVFEATKTGKVKPNPGKNIVPLEWVTKNNGDYTSEWHEHFHALMNDYIVGVHEAECGDEQCKTCDFHRLCSYKRPPKALEEDIAKKPVTDLTLSIAQEEAIYFRNGIARVNACAGAGKTLVMALFVVTLLAEGMAPEAILCITFTDAGARELRERIARYADAFDLEVNVAKLRCMTFNGFGNDIIAENYEACGYTRPPRVVDPVDRKHIIDKRLSSMDPIPGLDYEQYDCNQPNCKGALAVVSDVFDKIKSEYCGVLDGDRLREIVPKELAAFIKDPAAYDQMASLFYQFDADLRLANLIEYADQEAMLQELLQKDPYLLDDFGFQALIVDEFQDSSPMQLKLVHQLTMCPSFQTLEIAGDDSQSIFAFRGADPKNILEFFDRLNVPAKDRNDLFLTENYRSAPSILEFANKINALNKNRVIKDLVATRPDNGKPVIVKGFHNTSDKETGEYPWIVDEIQKRLDAGIAPEDIAVIAATRVELLTLAGMLFERGIASVLLCPEPMLDNSRVQAAIALFHALKDPYQTQEIAVYLNGCYNGTLLDQDDEVVEQVINEFANRVRTEYWPGDDATKVAFIDESLDLLDLELEDGILMNFRERLDRLKTAKQKAEYCALFERFGGEAMKRPGRYPGVVLTTAHSSKGLEWPVCFVVVDKFDNKRDKDTEERRRLLFVAATRARDELIVTGKYVAYTKKENENDKTATPVYNRYLKEAHEVCGLEFDPVDHEKEAREAEKKAANAAKAKKAVQKIEKS